MQCSETTPPGSRLGSFQEPNLKDSCYAPGPGSALLFQRPKAQTGAQPQNIFSKRTGVAKPRLTSGGEAAAVHVKIDFLCKAPRERQREIHGTRLKARGSVGKPTARKPCAAKAGDDVRAASHQAPDKL